MPRLIAALAGYVLLLSGCALTGTTEHEAALPQPPSLVALINHSSPSGDLFNGQFCGGVVIAPREVLTAAHCLDGRRATTVDVVVSPGTLCSPTNHPQRLHVLAARAPKLDPGFSDDVAMLTVGTDLEGVAPAISADRGSAALVAWGWGRDDKLGKAPCVAAAVRLEPASPDACRRASRTAAVTWDPDTAFCARPRTGERRNTCTGDSGGPVYAGGEVVGIISWGPDCRSTSVGGYMRADDASSQLGWRALP